jgi:hypothetical protein
MARWRIPNFIYIPDEHPCTANWTGRQARFRPGRTRRGGDLGLWTVVLGRGLSRYWDLRRGLKWILKPEAKNLKPET